MHISTACLPPPKQALTCTGVVGHAPKLNTLPIQGHTAATAEPPRARDGAGRDGPALLPGCLGLPRERRTRLLQSAAP